MELNKYVLKDLGKTDRGPRCPCGVSGQVYATDADGEQDCPVFRGCGPCGCDGGCDRGDGCHTLAWARGVHPDEIEFDWRGRR